jgi:Rv0078B-related antitoxin
MLADEQTGPDQLAVLRAMSGARRLRLAEQLYWSARKMKAAGLRSQHPDWSEAEVNDEVRRIFSHART